MKKTSYLIDIEIDKLTNSIENVITGDSFPTDVLPLTKNDLKTITKKNGWNFDWKSEFLKPDRDVYKLTITNNTEVIQGLVSLAVTPDNVYMHLVENAPFNIGKNKVYAGVAGNLVHLRANFLFSTGQRVSFHSEQKQFSSTIM